MIALTIVVLLQVSAPTTFEARAKLTEGVRGLDVALDDFQAIITTRLSEHASKPHTGLRAESAEVIGADGLHALTVVSVIPGGPADVVGITVGDRIISMGRRAVTHETSEVAEALLNSGPGTLSLEVERDGVRQSVVISRSPLACLKQAINGLDEAVWLGRVSMFREVNARLSKWLGDTPDSTLVELYKLNDHYQQLVRMFQESVQIFQAQVGVLTAEACNVSS